MISVLKNATSDTRNVIMPHWAVVNVAWSVVLDERAPKPVRDAGPVVTSASAMLHSRAGQALRFVLPIRVIRVLQVPERPAAADGRDRLEVVTRRRRRRGPLQRPGVPRVVARRSAVAQRGEHVVDENGEARHLDERPQGG